MFINDQGCLLRKSTSGEHNLLLVFFLRENGLKYVLARKSSRGNTGASIPDLFEIGHLIIEQRDAGRPAFLKDYSVSSGHEEIGRSYRHLQAASCLTRFYERNLEHMEHYPEAWDLLRNALNALAEKPNPEAVLLKTCFLFARAEGYPIVAHWLESKPSQERLLIGRVLKSPLQEIEVETSQINRWITDMNRFFKRETDLLPFGDLN